ncbi:MAG: FAD-dependent oxidoreductase [Acetobacteraceae bacterium]|nr:FAD-dependent oxidoreductase [Acetobacteraceae bacterium]
MHVVVIGAGIVGMASVLELQRDGHAVTILEPGDPGGEQAASYGNGSLLNPSSVIPVSAPGIWKKVPGYLWDPLGPLAIRWRYLPRLLPWLCRFIVAGSSVAKIERTARVLAPLLAASPALHRALAEEAGVADLIQRNGVLFPFLSRADYEAEAVSWRIRADNGTKWIELSGEELHQREPSLDRRYRFALLVEENGQCIDPGAYVAALARQAQAQGAVLRRARALGFRIEGGRLCAVRTEGEEIQADRAVIAAGAHSRHLAAEAGDRVPLETERGYHVMIENPGTGPRIPMMPSDGKMSNVMTARGLRIAGQVELAGLAAAPNWQRAEILYQFARKTWPDLPKDIPPERIKFWMGHRPSMPDSLPCIGLASGCADVVHAFGHGHVGLTAGPMTGKLVAALIAERTAGIDLAPFSARRFAPN